MKEPSELAQALDLIIRNVSDNGIKMGDAHEHLPPPPENTSYGVYNNSPESEIHIRDYWYSVRKRLWLVLAITFLLTALITIYMARSPDIYQAEARVQVDLEAPNPALGSQKSSSIVFNSNDPAYFNTQLQILTSPSLLRRVVKSLDLEHNQEFLHPRAGTQSSTWQSLIGIVGLGKDKGIVPQTSKLTIQSPAKLSSPSDDMDEVNKLAPYVDMLQRTLTVKQIEETRLIEVRCNHSDPQIAAKVVNTIGDIFVLFNLEKKTETNTSTGDYLQKRIAELQGQIRSGEEQLMNYAKNNQILSLDPNQNIVVERLSGLNRQMLEAENDRKLAEAAYRAALAPGAAESLSAETAKQANDIDEKLAELRARKSELLVENTEEWPEVKEINQKIAALEKQTQENRSRAVNVVKTNLETRYKQAVAREESLRAAFNQQKSETVTQNEASINYRILQQEIETNKQLLDGLLQRSKENDVVVAGTPNNIHVADYAPVPKAPIGPKRLRAMSLGFLFSLGFGIGLALFIEYLDNTVRSTDDVEKLLNLPALAVVPALGSARRHMLSSTSIIKQRNSNEHLSPELLIGMDNHSAIAEVYRQLRTSVLLSTAGRAPKSLLVTSSIPAEGKTTTAVNTAVSLAQTNSSVLVIDADMRRPRMHKIFGVSNNRGLSSYLSSQMNEAELLSLIQQDNETGLYLLTAGPIPPNPAELLGSDQMRQLIKTVENTFSHIVIDSPPTASFTDAVLISSLVDGVLLVVHGNKTAREVVMRSRRILQDVGARIFGVVLNRVNPNHQSYYYYNHYYGKYYSDDSEHRELASGA